MSKLKPITKIAIAWTTAVVLSMIEVFFASLLLMINQGLAPEIVVPALMGISYPFCLGQFVIFGMLLGIKKEKKQEV